MTTPFFTSSSVCHAPQETLDGRTGPKSRPLMRIDETPTVLRWDPFSRPERGLELTLAIAIEGRNRAPIEIIVSSGETGPRVASLGVICGDPYQILSIPLSADALPASGPLILRLQTASGEPLWLFAPDASACGGLEYHTPHLNAPSGGPADAFLDRLCSMASLQTFSWKEGCVLDGLQALAESGLRPGADAAIRAHLDYFGFSSGDLVYESPTNLRLVNELTTIETTLPFAHIAAIDIRHPWISLVLDYWRRQLETHGQVHDGDMISSEGAYTVAYPMTAIGALLGEPRWMAVAEDLLIKTFESLVRPDGIYLRHFQDGSRTHRNWARGLSWLLLGHAQTLRHQPEPSEKVKAQLVTIADFAARHQLDDGLWSTYVDAPAILPDCAGSAGIAAAFAIAESCGLLPAEYRERALRSREALHRQLTAEGFPTGCSQSNKGGEELQRSGYRVASTYALGMLGNLEAFTR